MMRRWGLSLGLLTLALLIGGVRLAQGDRGEAVVWLVVYGLLAALVSPLAFPRGAGAAEARRRSAEDGRPIVYWRPGCRYCMMLRLRLLGVAGRAHWVDIWRDPDGAAAVRAVAGGNETVPTVVLADGEAHINPSPAWLRARLR
ncbi:glutaredoxin domain-containing protein [Actinocorallia sp. A-T 12471]|uniref:glutaredoxin domain-containing protein n=1 Tax=Actinocorallia sp. A-T 12471 TaxID=3089813 RepID=UPI0029CF9AE3|nr:glutaredoxin domain-containing protein [Actinocorallia sp. A-T 12471]MDX6741032.1 glutaredoxin domain-containing protein [Actinocorallia sp. A-T 12471]